MGSTWEGVAVRDQVLFVGFRGPVLRGNYVPVLQLRFDKPNKNELLLVKLDGLGIRDLTAIDSGLLILAGPVGDGPGGYAIYHWNGRDCLIGQDGPGGKCERVGHATHRKARQGRRSIGATHTGRPRTAGGLRRPERRRLSVSIESLEPLAC